MGHVTKDAPRIAHDLVGTMAFDVTDEPDTTHAAVQGRLDRGVELWGKSARSMSGSTEGGWGSWEDAHVCRGKGGPYAGDGRKMRRAG